MNLNRQDYSETSSHAGLTVHADRSTHQLAIVLADRQAQPGAAVISGCGNVGLYESLEDAVLLRLRHADAGIMHLKKYQLVVSNQGRSPQRNGALVGELAGVAEEVYKDCPELGGVVVEYGQAVRQVEFQLVAVLRQ